MYVSTSIHCGYLAGTIGRITELHARYYAAHSHFDVFFESKVARELAQFCADYVHGRDGIWLLRRDQQIEGSIVIDASHVAERGAHLRWFIASEAIRGTGAGTALLGSALEFCRARAYGLVYLHTFAGLDAARHLYDKSGFRLVHEQTDQSWGQQVLEQRFELQL